MNVVFVQPANMFCVTYFIPQEKGPKQYQEWFSKEEEARQWMKDNVDVENEK